MPPASTYMVQPSPKRKREQTPFIPLLDTSRQSPRTSPSGSPAPEGAESPRNAVADQLRGMSLETMPTVPMSPLSAAHDVFRKKAKLNTTSDNIKPLSETQPWKLKRMIPIEEMTADSIAVSNGNLRLEAVLETPQSQVSQPRIISDFAVFARQPIKNASTAEPQSQQSKSENAKTILKDPAPQARQSGQLPTPPLSELTWHDSEITGHIADPSIDPDDDGTGLNGIGFQPTPAIAHARNQRRKQQLAEWKARESREARAKRSERRRRGIGGLASRETTVERELPTGNTVAARRTVKFAV